MSQSSAPPIAVRVLRLVPLQCATEDGQPYKRRRDIEDRICAVLRRPPGEWPALVQEKGANRLPSEVLVYLITVSKAIDQNIFGALVHELGLRIGTIAKDFAKGFDKDTRDEIIWGVEANAVELILADPPCRQGEYLQISFRNKIEQWAINATSKRRNAPQSLRHAPGVDMDGGEEPENPTDLIADESPNPEDITAMLQDRERRPALLAAAKAAVTNPLHLEAVILRYAYDWPISDKDPNVPTLARRYRKSPRQIQNWITDALEAMRAVIGERK